MVEVLEERSLRPFRMAKRAAISLDSVVRHAAPVPMAVPVVSRDKGESWAGMEEQRPALLRTKTEPADRPTGKGTRVVVYEYVKVALL